LQPRKGRTPPAWPDAPGRASMGPWLCSHGRVDRPEHKGDQGDASMGPWLCSHGRDAGADEARRVYVRFNGAVALQPRKAPRLSGSHSGLCASMGPWLCSHGRHRTRGRNRTAVSLLQWGRGFAATEGVIRRLLASQAAMLQWGRGFAATEGGSSEVISYQGPRVPFASTPAFLRLLPTFRIITVSVNRYTAAN